MQNIEIIEGVSDADIAEWLTIRLTAAFEATSGEVAISVPGGSTPFPIFEQVVKAALPFDRLVVWPGDDRIVPEHHAASNTGKIRALFEPVGAKVHALSTSDQPPRFALCWLGMGGDGHIASLFPNTDPQTDDPKFVKQLTPDPLPPEAPFDRITLTIPSLLNSEALMFVIRGKEKRAVLDAAMVGDHDLPVARLLRAADQPVTCFT